MRSGTTTSVGIRLNLDQIDAGLEGGWRTDEELPLTMQAEGPHLDLRNECLHLDEDNEGCRNRQWSRGVQDDADGAVVGVGIDRVHVRHLDESEQGEKGQAHQHHDVG